jgi:hypothetical protein
MLLSACGGGGDWLSGAFDFVPVNLDARTGVAHGGGRFVSTGRFGIKVSDDGGSFASVSADQGLGGSGATFGSAGWVVPDGFRILTSPDGSVWSEQVSPGEKSYRAAAFGAGRYVLVGLDGAIATSSDALTWTEVESGTHEQLLGVGFAEDLFIAVGSGGTALMSEDGAVWSALNVPTGATLTGASGGDGVLLLTGEDGTLLRSVDGFTWIRVPSGTRAHLNAVAFGDGLFVVVGEQGNVLFSSDGASTFAPAYVEFGETPWGADLFGVAYGDGVFVAVGALDVVSPDGAAWVRTAS